MADSPLSITASVTGILTFVAAILAFIYVRYNIIRNGNIEMITIFKSVAGFIVETITIAETTGSGDHVRSGSLQELITEQLRTEIGVIKKCMVALGVDPAQIPSDPYSFVSYDKLLQRHRNIIGLYRSALEAYSKSSNGWRICMHRLDGCIQINRPGLVLFWAVTLYLSSFGVSPMQLRWYRVRDSVLEMIQRRETLRSQLLFHQISLMNLWVVDNTKMYGLDELMF